MSIETGDSTAVVLQFKQRDEASRFSLEVWEREYFMTLAMDIASGGGFGERNELDVLREAAKRQPCAMDADIRLQTFLAELMAGKTARAQGALSALRSAVFLQRHWDRRRLWREL